MGKQCGGFDRCGIKVVGLNRTLWLILLLGGGLLVAGVLFLRLDISTMSVGTVEHERERVIVASGRGKLSSLMVRPGDRVEAGTELARLRDTNLEMSITRLRNELAQASYLRREAELALEEAKVTGAMPELELAAARAVREAARTQELEQWMSTLEGARREGLVVEEKLQEVREDYLEASRALETSRQLSDWKEGGLENIRLRQLESRLAYAREQESVLTDELALLEEKREALIVRAPWDGLVADIYLHQVGVLTERGDPILKIVDESSGYVVRTYVGERNIDLLREGQPARMKSLVYTASLEGYSHGKVVSVARGSRELDGQRNYEVLVSLEEFPYEPVNGSRMEVRILLGKGSMLSQMLNRPTQRDAVASAGGN